MLAGLDAGSLSVDGQQPRVIVASLTEPAMIFSILRLR
jgi:hypothetical protein